MSPDPNDPNHLLEISPPSARRAGQVVVVGSINHDLVITVKQAPEPGETVYGDTIHWFPGGKGANQAVAAARYVGRAALVGRTGADASGQELRAYLDAQGLQLHVELDTQASTGTAIIVVDQQGENRITVVPGANWRLNVDTCPVLDQVTASDIVLVQNEINYDATYRALVKAKTRSATTVFNCAPSRPIQDDVLRYVDYLVVNEVEYQTAFGEPLETSAPERQLSRRQTTIGCNLILTRGSRGIIAALGDEVHSCAGHPVEAVDTTGAGDCWVGAFAAELLLFGDRLRALQFANAAAALSVQRPGASRSFPTRSEVVELVRRSTP